MPSSVQRGRLPRSALDQAFGPGLRRRGLGFAFRVQARRNHQAESSSLFYRPLVHLRLLSTSPRGDAVTFSYKLEDQV